MSGFGPPPKWSASRPAAITTAVVKVPMTRDMTDVYLRFLNHRRTLPGGPGCVLHSVLRSTSTYSGAAQCLASAAPMSWLHDSSVQAAGSHG